jgi:hypothetical protein
MQSSRDEVLALIRRWQSEKCSIKVEFNTVDHSLEINCPPILLAHLDTLDEHAFWLSEPGPREAVGRIYGIHVKLTSADGYEIINIRTEAHPTFQLRVDYSFCLRVPFGASGDLFIYAMEIRDARTIM